MLTRNFFSVRLCAVVFASIYLIAGSRTACGDEAVLGAMKAFREFCMGSNPSIDSITDRVKDRQYKLIVDRTIAGANSSTMLQKTWLVEDRTGEFSLIVTQNNDANARRVMCGVTLPKETELGVERALTEPSQFGPPDSRQHRVDGSNLVSWVRKFDWGTAEVNLITQLPTLSNGSMLSVVYQLN
jgi:hypothetical protein